MQRNPIPLDRQPVDQQPRPRSDIFRYRDRETTFCLYVRLPLVIFHLPCDELFGGLGDQLPVRRCATIPGAYRRPGE